MEVTLQLYTVPGQVHYNSTRQLVLRGADGVVFVADSQRTMRSSNIDSLGNLQENLMLQGVDIHEFPHVIQFNKRDLRDLISIEDMDRELNSHSMPFFEATAIEGTGVQETLEGIVKLVMRSLRERYEPVAAPAIQPTSGRFPTPAKSQPGAPPPVAPVRPPIRTAPPPPGGGGQQPVRPPAAAPRAPAAGGVPGSNEQKKVEDEIPTGVYSVQRDGTDLDDSANLTTASFDGPPDYYPGAIRPPSDITGQAPDVPTFDFAPPGADQAPPPVAQPMADEPTNVREDDSQPAPPAAAPSPPPPIAQPPVSPEPPRVVIPPAPESETPFADQPTDTNISVSGTESIEIGAADGGKIAFGEESAARQQPTLEASPPVQPALPVDDVPAGLGSAFAAVGPDDLAAAGVEEDSPKEEATSEPDAPTPAEAPLPDADLDRDSFSGSVGSVDDLVASVLEGTLAAAGKVDPAAVTVVKDRMPAVIASPAPEVEPPPPVEEPPAAVAPPPAPAAEPEPAVPTAEPPVAEAEPPPSIPKTPERLAPVTIGEGDPFTMPADDTPPPGGPGSYVLARSSPAPASGSSGGIIQLGDNQLQLRLEGTGAIAESGQVRALDIEVPVPGSWVGNRRVTLQLRLTLAPMSEDEDGGAGGTS